MEATSAHAQRDGMESSVIKVSNMYFLLYGMLNRMKIEQPDSGVFHCGAWLMLHDYVNCTLTTGNPLKFLYTNQGFLWYQQQ
jgi:hypothetical protein